MHVGSKHLPTRPRAHLQKTLQILRTYKTFEIKRKRIGFIQEKEKHLAEIERLRKDLK